MYRLPVDSSVCVLCVFPPFANAFLFFCLYIHLILRGVVCIMSNLELVGVLLDLFREFFVFMLPVIGVMGGLSFIMNALYSIVFGIAGKSGGRI